MKSPALRTQLPAESPAPRRLGHPQMAFVRCWAEGLDMAASWNRYMFVDGAADARRARGELQRLLDELRNLARAHGRPEIAALLRRDPEAILEQSSKKPTLEEFRNRQPPDFYTEAELIEIYQAEFGARDSRSPARRKQRLRERLVRRCSGSRASARASRGLRIRFLPGSTSAWQRGWPGRVSSASAS